MRRNISLPSLHNPPAMLPANPLLSPKARSLTKMAGPNSLSALPGRVGPGSTSHTNFQVTKRLSRQPQSGSTASGVLSTKRRPRQTGGTLTAVQSMPVLPKPKLVRKKQETRQVELRSQVRLLKELTEGVVKQFPNAMPMDIFGREVGRVMSDLGFGANSTLGVAGLTRDEACRPFLDILTEHYGASRRERAQVEIPGHFLLSDAHTREARLASPGLLLSRSWARELASARRWLLHGLPAPSDYSWASSLPRRRSLLNPSTPPQPQQDRATCRTLWERHATSARQASSRS